MINLHWEMSVLSRAIAYPNLSAAAAHVGLSQPQLSRIVSRIEHELHVTLLDRSARRKSGWNAAAFRLAEVYSNSERKLESEIQKLVKSTEPTQLRVGTLEGLGGVAQRVSRFLLRSTTVSVVRLDVHDLSVLEELFLAGEMDLLLSSREPGRRKFRFSLGLGYQTLEKTIGAKAAAGRAGVPVSVFSSFEFGARLGAAHQEGAKCFVSNSLELRKTWIRQFGGSGIIPSEVTRQRSAGSETVLLIGADTLSPKLWGQLASAELK